ncbi:MAG: hypothetical protein ACTSUB_02650 [Candidatus Thorarchaeota archaeon]
MAMIDKLAAKSKELLDVRKSDKKHSRKMKIAAKGQAPKYLIISPINRSSQDLQLLGFAQGDAFHGTRVPGHALPPPSSSLLLFAGPAAYNRHFLEKLGVILTFEQDEPDEVIVTSLSHVEKHSDLDDIPAIALRVNYDTGEAEIFEHHKKRDKKVELNVLRKITKPDKLDDTVLVLMCSDSRVQPPQTLDGVPMAIQTLGGHIADYSLDNLESVQLDKFLDDWLSVTPRKKQILVIAHGNFEGEGPSCGAAMASLDRSSVKGDYLCPVIDRINHEASKHEDAPPMNAEERVISLAQATKQNLLTYPAIAKVESASNSEQGFIRIIKMDTVSNVVSE